MKKLKPVDNKYLEAKIGGIPCVLVNGRWVRSKDFMPYDYAKRNEAQNV